MSIHDELLNDIYKPSISKPSLQQYDNYQIHDIYCEDIEYQSLANSPNPPPENIKFINRLAVEAVSPYGLIECNFEAIALLYP